jgi:hypothetical protein
MLVLQSTKVTIQSHYTRIEASINKILLTVFLTFITNENIVKLFMTK